MSEERLRWDERIRPAGGASSRRCREIGRKRNERGAASLGRANQDLPEARLRALPRDWAGSEMSAVILGAARTPIGAFPGRPRAALPHRKLGSIAIRCALERAGVKAESGRRSLHGERRAARAGVQAPARQASLGARDPELGAVHERSTRSVGSGLKSGDARGDTDRAGEARLVVAGGMESMSNAPYLARGLRAGLPLGEHKLEDANLVDGLMDAYGHGAHGSRRRAGRGAMRTRP